MFNFFVVLSAFSNYIFLDFAGEELQKVNKNVAKRRHNLYYEVRLISHNNEKLDKPKKVYLYISPKVRGMFSLQLNIIN
jgi:hypothetical protein